MPQWLSGCVRTLQEQPALAQLGAGAHLLKGEGLCIWAPPGCRLPSGGRPPMLRPPPCAIIPAPPDIPIPFQQLIAPPRPPLSQLTAADASAARQKADQGQAGMKQTWGELAGHAIALHSVDVLAQAKGEEVVRNWPAQGMQAQRQWSSDTILSASSFKVFRTPAAAQRNRDILLGLVTAGENVIWEVFQRLASTCQRGTRGGASGRKTRPAAGPAARLGWTPASAAAPGCWDPLGAGAGRPAAAAAAAGAAAAVAGPAGRPARIPPITIMAGSIN